MQAKLKDTFDHFAPVFMKSVRNLSLYQIDQRQKTLELSESTELNNYLNNKHKYNDKMSHHSRTKAESQGFLDSLTQVETKWETYSKQFAKESHELLMKKIETDEIHIDNLLTEAQDEETKLKNEYRTTSNNYKTRLTKTTSVYFQGIYTNKLIADDKYKYYLNKIDIKNDILFKIKIKNFDEAAIKTLLASTKVKENELRIAYENENPEDLKGYDDAKSATTIIYEHYLINLDKTIDILESKIRELSQQSIKPYKKTSHKYLKYKTKYLELSNSTYKRN